MKLRILVFMTLSYIFLMTGCQKSVDESWVYNRYELTVLKFSTSSDVLSYVGDPESELLSQSESVVASYGEAKKGSILWFNVVAFDEESLLAARKYAFLADEKSRHYVVAGSLKQGFDAEAVVGQEILDKPYANENERRIAVIRNVNENFTKDMNRLASDSRALNSMVLMAKQTLNRIVQILESSPAKAVRISEYGGLEFDHMMFGKGRVKMVLEGDIAKVKVKFGSLAEDFETQPDVMDM